MVGHHCREHDKGEREEEEGEQDGVKMRQSYHFAEYSEDEHCRIERAEQLYRRDDEQCAVDAREPHQCLIDEVRHIHEVGKQRMAIDVVARSPVAHDGIGDGVETGNVELTYEKPPIAVGKRREDIVIMCYHQGIECHEYRQQHGCQPPFLRLYAEDGDECTAEGIVGNLTHSCFVSS